MLQKWCDTVDTRCDEFKLTTVAFLHVGQNYQMLAPFRPSGNESLEWGVIFTQLSFTAEVFALLLSGIFTS